MHKTKTQPSANHPNSSFRWETDLCASFLAKVGPQIWSKQTAGNWLVIEESTCSDGRADQVWARIESGWKCEPLTANASLLMNPTNSRVLAALKRNGKLAEEQLLAFVGVSTAVLRKALKALISASLVVHNAEKLYKLAKEVMFPKVEVCSFEMKLDNWKRALYQSTRYRSFSHRVFVVMPSDSVKAVKKNKDSFKKLGIGLIEHDANGETKVLIRPSKRDPLSNYQSLMALGMLLTRGSCLRFAN